MKKTKMIVSLLLCAVMLFAIAGCSGSGDKAKLTGSWISGKVDLSAMIEKEITASFEPEQAPYFHVDDYSMQLVFTFNEDDTFSLGVDEDSIRESAVRLKDSLRGGMADLFNDMAEENGITIDQLVEAMGSSTLDELLDEAFSDDTVAQIVDETVGSVEQKGKYSFSGGKLVISAEDGSGDVFSYTFNEDGTLTLDEEEADEDELDLFPLTFSRL